MTALAFALAFCALVAGAVAWRWLSLAHPVTEPEVDPARFVEALRVLEERSQAHESKLNSLMLVNGLRPTRESRV